MCVSRLRESFWKIIRTCGQPGQPIALFVSIYRTYVCLGVDAALALRATLSTSDQGLLDSVLVGASRWLLRQQGLREKLLTEDARRRECGALPSGLEHRWLELECLLFDEVRARPPDAVQFLPQLLFIARRYGLIVQNADEKTVSAQWDLLSGSPAQVSEAEVPDSAVVFVDGSAQLPAEKRFRKAGFSAVLFSGDQGFVKGSCFACVRLSVPRSTVRVREGVKCVSSNRGSRLCRADPRVAELRTRVRKLPLTRQDLVLNNFAG